MSDARIDPILRPPETRLRAWSEIALLTQVGMEMVWAALWYTGLFEDQLRAAWWGVWLVLWALIAGTYALARLLENTHTRLRLRQAIFLGWILFGALLSLKLILYPGQRTDLIYLLLAPIRSLSGADANVLPFVHIFLAPLLILRGVALASALPDVRSALLDFQLGLVALLLHGLLYLPRHPGFSSAGLFLFLFLGLLTMSATRIAGVTNFRGGRLARLGPTWAAGILSGALAVVAAGLLIGNFASGFAGELVSRIFLVILGLLGMLVVMLLFPLINVLAALINFIMQTLANRFPADLLANLQKSMSGLQSIAGQIFEGVRPTLHLMRILLPLAGLGAIIVLVLVWLRLRELDLQAEPETDTAGLPAGSLLGVLRRLVRRGLRVSAPLRPAHILAAARIRRVYAELLALCERLGAPRAISLTPLEFLPHAGQLFPGRAGELDLITRAYVQIRYGEYPESREEVEKVMVAWRSVKKDGARMLRRLR